MPHVFIYYILLFLCALGTNTRHNAKQHSYIHFAIDKISSPPALLFLFAFMLRRRCLYLADRYCRDFISLFHFAASRTPNDSAAISFLISRLCDDAIDIHSGDGYEA